MSASDFEEIVRRWEAGQLLIGVDRASARRFYTDISLREVEARTGAAPHVEKTVIYIAFLGGPLLLLASLFSSVWILGWWSTLFIPAATAVWVAFYIASSVGTARITLISLIVSASAIGLGLSGGSARLLWGLAFAFTLSLWLSRLLYVAAPVFLRNLALRNRRAWEWLHEYFVVKDAG